LRHCFFFLSVRFATSLTFFVLFPQLFSSSARSLGPAEPFHGPQRVARRSRNVLAEARRIDSRPRPQVGARHALMPNLPSTLASPRGPSFKSRGDGQAVVSSRRNCDIKEQETGVGLATKLLQIVRSQLRPRRAKNSILRLWISRDERHFALRFGGGSISMGRQYQLTNSSHPVRGESSSLACKLSLARCLFDLPKICSI
jgi:hypothetical protein